jgi:serine/threonine protein kinase
MYAYKHSPAPGYLGRRFGNYRLTTLLGKGSFATVYLGEHIYLDMPAAVKILRSQLTDADVRKFFAEARLVARLVHPHIVRVLEFDLERRVPFLVMDYAPNGTVRNRHLAGSRLNHHVILSYAEQMASAVQYIHEKKLIHRDIKPENLLLGPNDELLLSDFGIAIEARKASASEQVPVGTVAYMAPEQVEGRPCLASDQYALAVVVYEWLCGVRPFQGSMGEIIYQHRFVPPPSLCKRIPNLPPDVDEVVCHALAKDPRNRFESVQEFASALRNAFEDRPMVVIHDLPPRPAQLPQVRQLEHNQKKTRGVQQRKNWQVIVAFYAINLLIGAALGCILYILGVAPPLLEPLLALCMVSFPLGGAFAKKNSPLFFLTWSIAVAATMAALFSHTFVLFIVVYAGLLLLSLLTAFAVSINDIWYQNSG